MSNIFAKFALLTRYQEVAPFLESVTAAADDNKNALGFFAASVFREFALSEQLYVVTETHSGQPVYAGHLLFNCRSPKASVLQIYVPSFYRGRGVATMLLDHLKSALTEHGFISIYARVAEDLVEANAFWEKQDFYVQRVTPGGAARKRTILVRSHELTSPQLFESSGLSSSNPLGLDFDVVANADIPLFLLDLNVLFDLGPRRIRNEEALDLFRVERMGLCRFAISTELSNELQRTATPGRTDPMQAYMKIFPAFPLLSTEEWKDLPMKLASLVFPEKKACDLSENDNSDLRHLATAVQHRLAGFITNDSAILNAAARIKDEYNIQVISPLAIKQTSTDTKLGDAFDTPSSDTLTLQSVTDADEPAIHALLAKLNLSGSAIATGWAIADSGRRISVRQGIWICERLLGYLTWSTWSPDGTVSARIAVDESTSHSLNAARILLSYLLEHATAAAPTRIRIEFPPQQVHVREVAAGMGFSGTSNQSSLSKLVLGRIVTQANWDQCKEMLNSVGHLKLPSTPPVFRNVSQQIQILTPNGNKAHLPLESLETLLAPALFCLPGRGAVITPVQRDFSEHLLGHSPQKTLLPQSKVALYREKHYLSAPRTLKHFKRGGLILFYESLKRRGLGAIVAVARIQQAYLKAQDALNPADLNPSVLDASSLEAIGRSKMKTVTVFDNIMHFPYPIPLDTLKQIGCGSPTNLLTTHPITDEQLQTILTKGTARG